jgi:hypothetical protein
MVDAGGDIEAAHVVDHQRHGQRAQAVGDGGQHLRVGPQLRMQAGVGQARRQGEEIVERRAAGEVGSGPAAVAKAGGAHAAFAQAFERLGRVAPHDDDAAQVGIPVQRVEQQREVVAVRARMHQHAMRQAQPRQQRLVLRRERLGWRVAAVGGERIARVGPEEMGVAIPAAGAHCASRCGSANAGEAPSGSGISCAFSVIATIV